MSLRDILSKYEKKQQNSISGNTTLDKILLKYDKPPLEEDNEENSILDRLGGIADVAQRVINPAGYIANKAESALFDRAAENPEALAFNNDTYAGSAANAAIGGLTNTWEGIARLINADDTADKLQRIAQAVEDKTPVDAPSATDWEGIKEFVTNPHGLARSGGNMLGSMAALAPAMPLLPESAATAGTAFLGRMGLNRLLQGLISRGNYDLAKQIAQRAPWFVRYAMTSAPVEGMAEGGGVREELLTQGKSNTEATARGVATAALNVPLLMATNLGEAATLGMPFFKPISGGFVKGLLGQGAQAAARTGLNAFQNAVEEFGQEGISAGLSNRTPEYWKAFNEGFWGSLPIGAGSNIYHAVRGRKQQQSDIPSEDISLEDYAKRVENALRSSRIADEVQQVNSAGQNIAQNQADIDLFTGQQQNQDRTNETLNTNYFQKWSSRNGMDTSWDDNEITNTRDFKPSMVSFLNDFGAAMSELGVKPIITGGADKYGHASGTYSHANGYKVDIDDKRISEGSAAYQKMLEIAAQHGAEVVHEANNGHYDIVIRRDDSFMAAATNSSNSKKMIQTSAIDKMRCGVLLNMPQRE